MVLEDRIQKIEEEIKKTPYNKATSHHIGKLKAKLSQLREESFKRASSGTKGKGFHLKKSGDSTVALVGFPSVGKSTILNQITNAESKIGAYEFTTLEVIPGVMEYRGAQIQIFDIPGIISGAAHGKGRGREILSVARNSDLIVMVLDVFQPQKHLELILEELNNIGIRPNQFPPDVKVKRRRIGGVKLASTVPLTHMDERTLRSILNEYGVHSADVLIREDVTIDRFIDSLDSSIVYIPLLLVVNKIDLVDTQFLNGVKKKVPDALYLAADKQINIDDLKEDIFQRLKLIRIYLKPQGKKVDMEEPLIVRKGSTVENVAQRLHRDFVRNFRHSKVWGKSVKFPGQKVGLDHVLEDKDILRIIVKK
ncbi:MAG TPA: GTP-binding protein [Methanobacteriaceae archaeon]|nr:GTP-binding protein [Methanobacteriaceae archaeon]